MAFDKIVDNIMYLLLIIANGDYFLMSRNEHFLCGCLIDLFLVWVFRDRYQSRAAMVLLYDLLKLFNSSYFLLNLGICMFRFCYSEKFADCRNCFVYKEFV